MAYYRNLPFWPGNRIIFRDIRKITGDGVMISRPEQESGVSEVVGEMLMIGLVIILIGVFAAALGNFLPTSRDPSVTILMTTDNLNGTITLWHKGGDWVKKEDLTVVVSYPNDTLQKILPSDKTNFIMVPDKTVFDLGSNITVHAGTFAGNETVSLVTPHARIFTGRVEG
jgi:FlaG/FlaF family flagellin (archaellin)